MATAASKTKTANGNGAQAHPEQPYVIGFTVRGTRSFFFNRYDVDEFYEVDASPKGSKVRRDKDPMRLVWRDEVGDLCVPSTDFHKAVTEAGRYMPDVTATGRRSARPEVQRALIPVEELCSFGVDEPSAIDVRPTRLKNGATIPKARPILVPGWETSIHLEVALPEFFTPARVVELMGRAGRVMGIGDATAIGFGRFVITSIDAPREIQWASPEFS
jgi:hypothetical protein